MAKRTVFISAAAALFVSTVCTAAQSQTDQDQDSSRGVRIIAAPTPGESPSPSPKLPNADLTTPPLLTPATPPPAVEATSPAALTPAAPAQPIAPPPSIAPLTPALASPQSEVPAPAGAEAPPAPPPSDTLANIPTKPDAGGGPTQHNLEALASGVKIPNAAGLAMKILPGPEVATGSEVSFSVSSKKPGYLILVDVDASGKLTQIYPNPLSLLAPGGVREHSNFLRPGKVMQIPDRTSPYSGFQFIAAPPAGTALVVALLSDRPVQLVDLPDVPAPLLGGASTVDFLIKVANELRIPNASGNERLEDARWSFDVKFYAIR